MDVPMSKAMHKRYSSHEARAMSESPGRKDCVSKHRLVTCDVGAGINPGVLM